MPRFGHLPYVTGDGNKKLSKRDPESNLFHHRDRGFIPEGLNNYLALLGWSLSGDRDVFSLDEMVAAFDVADVNPNPARFDLKKAEAINGDHVRRISTDDFAERILPYLQGLISDPPTEAEAAILREAAPLVHERVNLLGESRGMLEFLFTSDDDLVVADDALPKAEEGALVLNAATAVLTQLDDFSRTEIERVLREALLAPTEEGGAGLKPRLAFGPLRAAVSGRRISPPLFESMEILGKESTLKRIEKLRARL